MTYQLHADHHIAIGHTHLSDGRPCQDHALSGIVKEYGDIAFAYAVLSDGCSSAGETDIGARLLTTLTAKVMRDEYVTGDQINIEGDAYEVANTLGLKATDLYATHLYAVIDAEGEGFVMVKGDGVVVFKSNAGALFVHKFEWADNMPYYPLYSQEGLQNFYIHHGGRLGMALTVATTLVEPNGEVTTSPPTVVTVETGAAGVVLPINDVSNLSMVCLFSDGICQIDKMNWIDAVKEATAFKNTAGTFVKRRMIRFIKDSIKQGRGPQDDLSLAVILVTQPEMEADPARTAYHDLERPADPPVETLNARGV